MFDDAIAMGASPMFPGPEHHDPSLGQDARRRAIISQSLDQVLAPTPAPAPAVVDNRPAQERMLELFPHSVMAGFLRELAAQRGRNG